MEHLETIRYDKAKNKVTILNQTELPNRLVYRALTTLEEVFVAIRDLEVRGAPLIGITAAYGLAMYAQNLAYNNMSAFMQAVFEAKAYLETARPTAVNLENALNRMTDGLDEVTSVEDGKALLLARAYALHEEDRRIGEAIGCYGAALLKDGAKVMTYCNAGLLATGNSYGTALAPVYRAKEQGKAVSVVACETRPILQGARLTTFELTYQGVDTTLITDNMMGWLLATHPIDAIFVGCDRVALNGDFANKIGTYTLAVMAKTHGIPFYVCTPSTTIDFSALNGESIRIEMRDPEEVRRLWYEKPMVTDKAAILNPAFDCTPASYVTGFITEKGILHPPFTKEMFEL
ncbi:MAG: S-methyl-5-thioribose-1-phosphate isomerase [Peptococcaceae bacterium]|nr:S-methyl-5-thioribose-1-phosphate isomerase [Peptococcaceae bacterium]